MLHRGCGEQGGRVKLRGLPGRSVELAEEEEHPMAGRRAGASMPHPQDTWLFAHCQSQLLALCPGFQVYKPLQSQLWVPAGEGSGSFLLRDQRHRQGYRDLLSSSRVGIGVGETRYSQHSSATKDCAYSHFPEGKGSQPRTQRQGGNRQGRNLTQAFSGSSRGLLDQSEEEGGGRKWVLPQRWERL